MEQTEEFDILKEHTKELLAPLSAASGTGHPQRHRNMQTQALAGITALAYPYHSALPFQGKLLWSHLLTSDAHSANPGASLLCKEAVQQGRCLGDETLRV